MGEGGGGKRAEGGNDEGSDVRAAAQAPYAVSPVDFPLPPYALRYDERVCVVCQAWGRSGSSGMGRAAPKRRRCRGRGWGDSFVSNGYAARVLARL